MSLQPTILRMEADIATLLILCATAIIYGLIWRSTVLNSHREATQQIYREWWSDELRELRRYFYREFVPLYRRQLMGKCLTEIESIIEHDNGRIRKLCYFFERVGWQGAAGLIDVDYILGPMQHCVRFVWMALEPFIMEERKPQHIEHIASSHHSVYLSGFEWLYRRSNRKHQAMLIFTKFRNPRLYTRQEIRDLAKWIDEDEAKFYNKL